jgi:hypothetical protein
MARVWFRPGPPHRLLHDPRCPCEQLDQHDDVHQHRFSRLPSLRSPGDRRGVPGGRRHQIHGLGLHQPLVVGVLLGWPSQRLVRGPLRPGSRSSPAHPGTRHRHRASGPVRDNGPGRRIDQPRDLPTDHPGHTTNHFPRRRRHIGPGRRLRLLPRRDCERPSLLGAIYRLTVVGASAKMPGRLLVVVLA